MLIAVVLAAIILLLQWPLGFGMFSLFQASTGVEAMAEGYFSLRIYGVPGFLVHLVNLGILFGLQEIKG